MFLVFLILINYYLFFYLLILLLLIRFLTLLERNILRIIQSRLGPLKVGVWRLLQAIMDALKLLSKNIGIFPLRIYTFLSMIFFMLRTFYWIFISPIPFLNGNFRMLYFLIISTISIFPILFIGWFSMSKYSLLGSIRCIILIISYEAVFAFVFLIVINSHQRFGFSEVYYDFFFLNIFIYFRLFVIFLCETRRVPFDLIERESELVNRYSTEFSRGSFTFLFLREYISIRFFLFFISLLFSLNYSLILFIFFFYLLCIIRGSLPRLKFYNIISIVWLSFLPIVVIFLFLIIILCKGSILDAPIF